MTNQREVGHSEARPMTPTVIELHLEIGKINEAMKECEDDCGVVKPWMNERLNKLVAIRNSFYDCIKYFEANQIGEGK